MWQRNRVVAADCGTCGGTMWQRNRDCRCRLWHIWWYRVCGCPNGRDGCRRAGPVGMVDLWGGRFCNELFQELFILRHCDRIPGGQRDVVLGNHRAILYRPCSKASFFLACYRRRVHLHRAILYRPCSKASFFLACYRRRFHLHRAVLYMPCSKALFFLHFLSVVFIYTVQYSTCPVHKHCFSCTL